MHTCDVTDPTPVAAVHRSIVRRGCEKLKLVAWRRPAARIAQWLQSLELRLLLASQGSYQPVMCDGALVGSDPRDCKARWKIIRAHLPGEARTAMDLGCAEGFFCFKLAAEGLTVVGVDNLPTALQVASLQASLNDVSGAAFLRAELSHELVDRLPEVDVVLFLSLMHHLMCSKGQDWCVELLRRLRRKTRLAMFFEMGQRNEWFHEWHALLPDMGPDPTTWITEFLRSGEFATVDVIGAVPADRAKSTRLTRAVFKAS